MRIVTDPKTWLLEVKYMVQMCSKQDFCQAIYMEAFFIQCDAVMAWSLIYKVLKAQLH